MNESINHHETSRPGASLATRLWTQGLAVAAAATAVFRIACDLPVADEVNLTILTIGAGLFALILLRGMWTAMRTASMEAHLIVISLLVLASSWHAVTPAVTD